MPETPGQPIADKATDWLLCSLAGAIGCVILSAAIVIYALLQLLLESCSFQGDPSHYWACAKPSSCGLRDRAGGPIFELVYFSVRVAKRGRSVSGNPAFRLLFRPNKTKGRCGYEATGEQFGVSLLQCVTRACSIYGRQMPRLRRAVPCPQRS